MLTASEGWCLPTANDAEAQEPERTSKATSTRDTPELCHHALFLALQSALAPKAQRSVIQTGKG